MTNLFELNCEQAKKLDRWLDDNAKDDSLYSEPVISVEIVDRKLAELVAENEKLSRALKSLVEYVEDLEWSALNLDVYDDLIINIPSWENPIDDAKELLKQCEKGS